MTEQDLTSENDLAKYKLRKNLKTTLRYRNTLEDLEGEGRGDISFNLALAGAYSDLSNLYSQRAMLTSDKRIVSRSIRNAQRYLNDAESQVSSLTDSGDYESEKKNVLDEAEEKITNLGKRFSRFESKTIAARMRLEQALFAASMEDSSLSGIVKLNREQAYAMAEVLRKAAKIAATDDNYGCGFLTSNREEEYKITKLPREQFVNLLDDKLREAEELLKKAGGNLFAKIQISGYMARLGARINFAMSSSPGTLFPLEDNEIIRGTMQVGSDTDRKYKMFISQFVRNPLIKELSPSVSRVYHDSKEWKLTSAVSLTLNGDHYQGLKWELPFLAVLDNPNVFEKLMELSSEKDGADKICRILLGVDSEINGADKLMMKISNALPFLPNQFVNRK